MIDVEKDPLRAERLNEVYRHLFAHFGIKTQKQMAERLKVQRTALSAAFNGNKAYLTKNLFMKICAAFPGVFNLDYLLNGEGRLLTPDEECKSSIIESSANHVDEQNAILEVYARMIRGIDDLRQELKKSLMKYIWSRPNFSKLVTISVRHHTALRKSPTKSVIII